MHGRTNTDASLTFARDKRIRKRRDFLRVQRFGIRSFGRFVVVVAQRCAQSSTGRIGITVPKKVGAAHERNKIKRRIRHIFRLKPSLFLGRSLVVIARLAANTTTFQELESDIIDTCEKLRSVQKPRGN